MSENLTENAMISNVKRHDNREAQKKNPSSRFPNSNKTQFHFSAIVNTVKFGFSKINYNEQIFE